MPATITTDHKWRNFAYRYDVPQSILKSQFDWTNEEDELDGFIKYRGRWYHLSEFERCDSIPGFDAIRCDSYFSGIVLKLSPDGEQFKIGLLIA